MEEIEEFEEAIERLEYFEPEDLVECAMYRNCIETIKKFYEELKEIKDWKEQMADDFENRDRWE